MNQIENKLETINEEPLNSPNVHIKGHFKEFIKNKSIEELIAYDNKLFSEVRNLESEKHILVTQNYKKFVSATETINTIKSSLVGFEKDLLTLQSKVQNLVGNFDIVNNSIESQLKESENIYKVKKDLKRLKFINDLPRVLEDQLAEYINGEKTNIKLLEKSLTYYEKCKEFLNIHKNNSLVKDIYNRTNNLIFKYRNLIQDELHIPEFNESSLEHFDLCLSLLVKIEDDKSDLILTFLNRYKFLISKKFDEIFGMREGVNEIDYTTYVKIYDNYEFAINENEFLFYENQIENELDKNVINNAPSTNIDIRNLSSKFFKKGTFIWICKKIQENIATNYVLLAYKYFSNVFDKKNTTILNVLYNHMIDLFNKKIHDIIEKSKNGKNISPDPIFFREGLVSFYQPFCETLQKIHDEKITSSDLAEKILKNNISLLEAYISNMEYLYITKMSEMINTSTQSMIEKNRNKQSNSHFDFNIPDTTATFNKIVSLLLEYLLMFKKMDLGEIYNTLSDETNKIYLKNVSNFIGLFYFVLKSANSLRFENLKYSPQMRRKVNEILKKVTKERIYTKIILCKVPSAGIKPLLDKILKEFPQIKNNKHMYNDLRSLLDKETTETLNFLFDALVQLSDQQIYLKTQEFFYTVDWINYDQAVTFRLGLRNFCYDLFFFRNELYELLDEERKNFEETNSSTLNEAMLWTKNQKRMTKYQKEMECLHIRRLSIYMPNSESPQTIMFTIAKIFLKCINEFVKLKKFSKQGFQQVQLDMNLIKYFFRENLIVDVEKILDGFFLEIMKNCSSNALNPESFDETLILAMLEENRKDFKNITN